MSELKTKVNDGDVNAFLAKIGDDQKRKDARAISAMMARLSGEKPKMWGGAIVGFGSYHYVYDSGREGEMPIVAFSARAQALTLYLLHGFKGFDALLDRLGKHSVSKACLYVKRLSDVDTKVLEELVRRSVATMRARYPKASSAKKKAAAKPAKAKKRRTRAAVSSAASRRSLQG